MAPDVRDRNVAHRLAHDPSERLRATQAQIRVSLWGVDAWRACRAGVQVSMIADLYKTADDYGVHLSHVARVLRAALAGDRFTSLVQFDEFVTAEVNDLNETHQAIFWVHRPRYQGNIAMVFGASVSDAALIALTNLVVVMLDGAYINTDPTGFTTAIAPIWFALCDAAVAAPVGVGT